MKRSLPAVLCVIVGLVCGEATAGGGWREIQRKDGLVLESRPAPRGSIWMRGSQVIPHPAERVASVLLDLAAFPEWVRRLARWEVRESSARTALVYGRHDLPWPLSDRDYLVRYTWQRGAKGRLRLVARSVADSAVPPTPDVVRLDTLETTWEVEPVSEESTRVFYTYRGEVGEAAAAVARWTQGSAIGDSFARLSARVALIRQRDP